MSLAELSNKRVTAMLFERFKNRPLPDPNRPRPVLDAIKAFLTKAVQEGGAALLPLLMQYLPKLLAGLGVSASSAEAAEDERLADELAARYQASASAALVPGVDLLMDLLLSAVRYVGPAAIGWVIEQLLVLLDQLDAASGGVGDPPATAGGGQ